MPEDFGFVPDAPAAAPNDFGFVPDVEPSIGERSFVDNLKNALVGVAHIPSALYHGTVGTAEEFVHHPIRAAKDVFEGAREYGQNTIAPLAAKFTRAAISTPTSPFYNPVAARLTQDVNIPTYTPEHPHASATAAGELGASLFPIGRGASLLEKLVRHGAESLPEFFGKRLATGIAGGAVAGAGVSPLTGMDPRVGALFGAAMPIGVSPVAPIARKLIGGTLKPEEFAERRASVPAGIRAPIHDIAESPSTRDLYALSSSMWGSGAGKPYHQLNAWLKNKQAEIKGTTVAPVQDANQFVFDAMKDKYEGTKLNTQNAYEELARAADETALPGEALTTPQEEIPSLQRSPQALEEEAVRLRAAGVPESLIKTRITTPTFRAAPIEGEPPAPTPITPKVPFQREALDKVINEQLKELSKKTRSEAGKALYGPSIAALEDFKRTPYPSFEAATNEVQVVNDLVSKAFTAGDKPLERQLLKIKKGFEESIDKSAEKQPHLLNLYKTAKNARVEQGKFEKITAKNKSPFFKVYEQGRGSQPAPTGNFISQYLKPSSGTTEQSGLLTHLTERIPEEAKKVMTSHYLESDTVPQFLNKLDKLSEKQRKILFGHLTPDVEHLLDMKKTFPKAGSAAFIPETGFGGTRTTQAVGSLLAAISAVASGHPTLAAILAGAGPAVGRGIQQTLRSEGLKNIYQRGLQGAKAPVNVRNISYLRGLLQQQAIQPQQGQQ